MRLFALVVAFLALVPSPMAGIDNVAVLGYQAPYGTLQKAPPGLTWVWVTVHLTDGTQVGEWWVVL